MFIRVEGNMVWPVGGSGVSSDSVGSELTNEASKGFQSSLATREAKKILGKVFSSSISRPDSNTRLSQRGNLCKTFPALIKVTESLQPVFGVLKLGKQKVNLRQLVIKLKVEMSVLFDAQQSKNNTWCVTNAEIFSYWKENTCSRILNLNSHIHPRFQELKNTDVQYLICGHPHAIVWVFIH